MIVTQSSVMLSRIRLAERAARSSAPILLTGESGTGKELFAQLVHQSSARNARPLAAVNCAALPENLVESELFGHERGAFSGAVSERQGRFEVAGDGTLFLDEITELPLPAQAKLLRVLESKHYERVGSSQSLQHDVRIISASNRDLRQATDEGTFRLDLLHRINVIEIHIPPLRERPSDIPLLAMHFLDQFRGESEFAITGFQSQAMQSLSRYSWPGNVRELRNVVHRACVLTASPQIGEEVLHLQSARMQHSSDGPPIYQVFKDADVDSATADGKQRPLPTEWLHRDLEQTERQIILAAIAHFGNRKLVSEKLGVSLRTLTNKLKRYNDRNEAA